MMLACVCMGVGEILMGLVAAAGLLIPSVKRWLQREP